MRLRWGSDDKIHSKQSEDLFQQEVWLPGIAGESYISDVKLLTKVTLLVSDSFCLECWLSHWFHECLQCCVSVLWVDWKLYANIYTICTVRQSKALSGVLHVWNVLHVRKLSTEPLEIVISLSSSGAGSDLWAGTQRSIWGSLCNPHHHKWFPEKG